MLKEFYEHWRDVPMDEWRWPNFHPSEIASKGDGSIIVHAASLDCLQRARDISGKGYLINSAYRDSAHNKSVGSNERSMHRKGRAFDISTHNHDPKELYQICKEAGFTGFGFYSNFLHVDTGRARWWGRRHRHRFI